MSNDTTGYEVEIKFRAVDHAALADRLRALGARAETAIEQEDLYLAHPARDFARSGEALRLRRVGSENRVTYKGPKLAGPTKTREEIELGFEPGAGALAQLERLMERLGFRPVMRVAKRREGFHLEFAGRPVEVVLDRVEGLGDFAEVEALAAGPADLPAAQAAVQALAGQLGLVEVEPRSYLRMVLERAGLPPGAGAGSGGAANPAG